jgi:hypothetical protein
MLFLTSGFFWFLMGIVAVFVGIGFKAFAEDKGWTLNWWKWLLTIVWYGIFSLSFLSWGTLIGEMEASAGWKFGLFGLFISLILGVGLWRLLSAKPKAKA